MDAPMQDVKERFYLDDLIVGQRFISRTHVIDEAQIKAFAHQFDPQPFHLDADIAKDTLFAGLVASGWQTASITMKLMVESGLPLAGGIIGAGGELAWPKPTRPSDTLQVESEVLEILVPPFDVRLGALDLVLAAIRPEADAPAAMRISLPAGSEMRNVE
jgi:acyl dehydratase